MITAFKITLLVVILFSLMFTLDREANRETKLNYTLLCVTGIVAFIVSSIVL